MIRAQIQFTEEQMAALRRLAGRRRRPVAAIVRESVDLLIAREAELSLDQRWGRARAAVGGYRSDASDVSENHDRYLADALAGDGQP